MNGRVVLGVAYADTDAGGVMYHGRYVELAERSRLLWMRQAGCAFESMPDRFGVQLVVQKLSAQFHRPARLGDELLACTALTAIGAARGRWRTEIRCGPRAVCTLLVDLAAIGTGGAGLVRVPVPMLEALGPLREAGPGHTPSSNVSD